jgi:Hint module
LYDTYEQQIGIASFAGCGLPNFPGVYTRVSAYGDWITDMICQYSGDPPSWCPPGSGFCFSGNNLVEVKDVGYITMNQLKIGDYVKSGPNQYTQVYGFGHYDHQKEASFLQIYIDDAAAADHVDAVQVPLEISSVHFLYVERGNKQMILSAADVMIGDLVYYLNDNSKNENPMTMKYVTKIDHVMRNGFYAPLTQSGDMIVNGIRVSNYVQLYPKTNVIGWYHQNTIGEVLYFPQRIFCQYFMSSCQHEIYIDGFGITAYVVIRLCNMMKRWGYVGYFIIALLTTPLLVMKDVIECVNSTTGSMFGFIMGSVIVFLFFSRIKFAKSIST